MSRLGSDESTRVTEAETVQVSGDADCWGNRSSRFRDTPGVSGAQPVGSSSPFDSSVARTVGFSSSPSERDATARLVSRREEVDHLCMLFDRWVSQFGENAPVFVAKLNSLNLERELRRCLIDEAFDVDSVQAAGSNVPLNARASSLVEQCKFCDSCWLIIAILSPSVTK
uniref:Uncharacterized protein n=1 Tax=Globodera pallida TaxID=36090 RepID=A0A183CI70_GLOPA